MAIQDDPNTSRRARMEELRRIEQTRQRRGRIVVISSVTAAVVAVAGLVGFGVYEFGKADDSGSKAADTTQTEAQAQGGADAKAPIAGEKDWDPKKLTRNHVTTKVNYPMKPPVGGDHDQVWMNCGGDVYTQQVPDMNAVHSLEHGAVWVTYTDKASAADVKKLADKVSKTPYSLMSPYKGQAGAIMLSAWGKQVTVNGADDPRVNQFFTQYVQGPQTPEPGAPCTGGLGEQ
ncbi:DUF3105 domain-containing protein [Streptomyces violascens]|uniref:Membrane protein n=1 Tax=Streptomyces violascens TaxID=67381 RepID=A0ABQ3QK97_9ACTN|nr:DUF3105 domain-containing protein [Streptomyces violascens]GGT93956.1 membrane protein [Streptomyces violascens]GHI37698.1 membrane protein [Streptomyces violascens]